jgi:hypothetical protein
MATYLLKQPNGLIAIFSSIVDDFTHWDCTPEEALAYGVEQWGRSEAQEKLDRALMDVGLWKSYDTDDGLGRWRETLKTIAFRHGVKHLKDQLETIGQGDAEIPQAAIEAARSVESDMDHESDAYKSRM